MCERWCWGLRPAWQEEQGCPLCPENMISRRQALSIDQERIPCRQLGAWHLAGTQSVLLSQ